MLCFVVLHKLLRDTRSMCVERGGLRLNECIHITFGLHLIIVCDQLNSLQADELQDIQMASEPHAGQGYTLLHCSLF